MSTINSFALALECCRLQLGLRNKLRLQAQAPYSCSYSTHALLCLASAEGYKMRYQPPLAQNADAHTCCRLLSSACFCSEPSERHNMQLRSRVACSASQIS